MTVAGGSGKGAGTLNVNVAVNTGPSRSATLVVAGNKVVINQTGSDSGCSFSVTPRDPVWFNSSGGMAVITVTPSSANCQWNVKSIPPWLSVSGGTVQRTGPASITASAGPNSTGATRSLMVNFAGIDVYFGQRGAPYSCTLTVSPTAFWASSAGGTLAVTVKAPSADCSWSIANPPVPWVTLSGASLRSGSSTVVFSIAPNSGAVRVATVGVAGKGVYITQHSKGN